MYNNNEQNNYVNFKVTMNTINTKTILNWTERTNPSFVLMQIYKERDNDLVMSLIIYQPTSIVQSTIKDYQDMQKKLITVMWSSPLDFIVLVKQDHYKHFIPKFPRSDSQNRGPSY